MAKLLNVSATYMSQVEREEKRPLSEILIGKLSLILSEDYEELMIISGRIPERVIDIIKTRPKLFTKLILSLENAPDETVENTVKQVRDGDW